MRAGNPSNIPLAAPQVIVPSRQQSTVAPPVQQRPTPIVPVKKHEHVDRATSPVDERILNEFYADLPKDIHQYRLEGRQYVVYEGANLTDIDTYRKGNGICSLRLETIFFLSFSDLTQAMLIQEPEGLRESIDRAKNSIHASTLTEEIRQAQDLAAKLGQK